MHLGPPPLVLPIRRPEDPESRSDDEHLSGGLTEISVSEAAHSQLFQSEFLWFEDVCYSLDQSLRAKIKHEEEVKKDPFLCL